MNIKQRQFFRGQPEAVPPVYVESMTLQEVRCFGEKQTLKFTKPDGSIAQWTVILGENGVGKTTVLQCLAGMQPESTEAQYKKEKISPGLMPRLAFLHEFSSSRKWYRQGCPVYNRPFPDHKEWLGLKVSLSTRSGQMNSTPSGNQKEWNICAVYEPSGLPTVNHTVGEIPNFAAMRFYAYGASRRMAVIGRKNFETSASAESETLFNNEIELNNAEEWLKELDTLASRTVGVEQKMAKTRLADVLEMLPKVLPKSMVQKVDFKIDQSPERVRVKFETPYGWLPIESLSYGYQTMISWIVDFVYRMYDRYPDAKDPLAMPAIVLVDEIDLHLHPKWQRELMGFLSARFPKTQFIVTAHSPLIIQSEEVANVILLQRDPNKPDQVIVRQDDVAEIRKWRLDQILTSDLYGLESAIAPSVEKLEVERDDILAKDALSAADHRRLAEIAKELEGLPSFSSREAVEAEQLYKKTVERLMNKPATKVNLKVAAKKLLKRKK